MTSPNKNASNSNIMNEYKEWWKLKYDPELPGLIMSAKLQRERLLKKPGEWEKMRNIKLQELSGKIYKKKEKKAMELYKKVALCANLSHEDKSQIPQHLLITLYMPNNKYRVKLCYNIVDLYSHLIALYGKPTTLTGVGSNWIDPTTGQRYSVSQINNILKYFQDTELFLRNTISGIYSVSEKPMDAIHGAITLPDNLYNNLISTGMVKADQPIIIQLFNLSVYNPKPIQECRSIYVSIDEFLPAYAGDDIKLSSDLMQMLGVQYGDKLHLQNCIGLRNIDKIVFYPIEQEIWSTVKDAEAVRSYLENYIGDNFSALGLKQIIPIVIDNLIIHLQIIQLFDKSNQPLVGGLVKYIRGMDVKIDFSTIINPILETPFKPSVAHIPIPIKRSFAQNNNIPKSPSKKIMPKKRSLTNKTRSQLLKDIK
jgi:hypothetical protein